MKNYVLALMIVFGLCNSILAQQSMILDSTYQEGELSFYRTFSSNFRVSAGSEIGTIILKWKVNDGQIQDITIINSEDKMVNRQLIKVLQSTQSKWRRIDSVNTYYLPIIFRTPEVEFHIDDFPEYFLEKMIVILNSRRKNFQSDEEIIKALNESLKDKEFNKAIDYLNELIRRNPMNKQLRENRIYCYQKINMKEKTRVDIDFIESYLIEIHR